MFHQELKRFGTVLKTHGIQGELIVSLVSDIPEKFRLPDTIFIVIKGIPVPFFPEHYEIISDNSLKIRFDTILNREEAMQYYNLPVMAETKTIDRFFPKQQVISLLNYTVYDSDNNKVGLVTEFDDIPGNPVITVESEGKTILLPASEELIIDMNKRSKTLVLRIPEGLL